MSASPARAIATRTSLSSSEAVGGAPAWDISPALVGRAKRTRKRLTAARIAKATTTEPIGTAPVELAGGVAGLVAEAVVGPSVGVLEGAGGLVDENADVELADAVTSADVAAVVSDVRTDGLGEGLPTITVGVGVAKGVGVASAATAGARAPTVSATPVHSAAAARGNVFTKASRRRPEAMLRLGPVMVLRAQTQDMAPKLSEIRRTGGDERFVRRRSRAAIPVGAVVARVATPLPQSMPRYEER